MIERKPAAEELTRADDSMRLCSLGKVPRFGMVARRANDCSLDCRDYDACEGQPAAEKMKAKR